MCGARRTSAALPAADWVIDAAANPSVLAGVDGQTSSRQLVEHNLYGTINLLEYCKAHKAGFILLSTSRVYAIKPLAELKVKAVENAFRPDAGEIAEGSFRGGSDGGIFHGRADFALWQHEAGVRSDGAGVWRHF